MSPNLSSCRGARFLQKINETSKSKRKSLSACVWYMYNCISLLRDIHRLNFCDLLISEITQDEPARERVRGGEENKQRSAAKKKERKHNFTRICS